MKMTNKEYVEEYSTSRGLRHRTHTTMQICLNHYSNFQNMTLHELLEEADMEEEQGIRWKKRTLKKRLINYMNYCKRNMTLTSAKSYLGRVKGFYVHHEIEIGKLPKWNTKNAILNEPILSHDLPTKEILMSAFEKADPVMKAILLTAVSTGMSRVDILSLTIQDFLTSTYEVHKKNNIQEALPILLKEESFIPTLSMRRHKNNKYFFTFMTTEAMHEICNYLLIRDKRNKKYKRPLIQPEDKLFKISNTTYGDKFVELNNALKLGKKGAFNRLRSHMLRKYHATTLEKNGMSREHVRILQGKSNSKVDEAYFYPEPETLQREYVKSMDDLLLLSEVKEITTESPEYQELQKQNKELKEKEKQIDEIWNEINNIKERENIWESLK